MEPVVKEDLILKYIQNRLTAEEKMKLFELTLADEEFREGLKEELELAKKIKDNSIELDQKVKDRIYQEVRLRAVKEDLSRVNIGDLVMKKVLRFVMPKITQPIVNLLRKN